MYILYGCLCLNVLSKQMGKQNWWRRTKCFLNRISSSYSYSHYNEPHPVDGGLSVVPLCASQISLLRPTLSLEFLAELWYTNPFVCEPCAGSRTGGINSNLTVSYSWICAYAGRGEHSMILVCLLNECWVDNNDTAFLSFLVLPLAVFLSPSLGFLCYFSPLDLITSWLKGCIH